MIEAVDKSIGAFLKAELPPDIGPRLSVSFAPVDAHFPSAELALPAVNLFLYNIGENLGNRDNAPTLQRLPNGAAQKVRPPAFLDCSYLVTVWTDPKAADPMAEEHAILGAVTKVLLAHPVLPTEALQGSLQGTQTAPVAGKLATAGTQSPSETWQAMGGRPKLFLNYTVTFTMPLFEPEQATVVTEKQIRFRSLVTAGSE